MSRDCYTFEQQQTRRRRASGSSVFARRIARAFPVAGSSTAIKRRGGETSFCSLVCHRATPSGTSSSPRPLVVMRGTFPRRRIDGRFLRLADLSRFPTARCTFRTSCKEEPLNVTPTTGWKRSLLPARRAFRSRVDASPIASFIRERLPSLATLFQQQRDARSTEANV